MPSVDVRVRHIINSGKKGLEKKMILKEFPHFLLTKGVVLYLGHLSSQVSNSYICSIRKLDILMIMKIPLNL